MAVYKKGNSYYIDYYFEGRRKRERIGIDRKLAEVVLAKRKVEIAEGRFLDRKEEPEKIPEVRLYEIIDDFLLYSKNTKKSYSRDLYLVKQLKMFFDNMVLSRITPWLIEKYRSKRLTAGKIKNATVNREVGFLKATFNLAIRNKKAKENPIVFVKKLKEPDGRVRFLSQEELNRLLDACNKYFKPIVICALFTGMRRNEMLYLQWKDVDMNEGFIHIINSKNNRTRYIPIYDTLRRTLEECKEWSDGTYVFCSSKGEKYSSVHSLWNDTIEKACIEDFRLHDLRHTAASYLVMSSIDLVTVKEVLGHRTLDMTLRYSHLSKTHVKNAMNVLGAKLDSMINNRMDTQVDTKEKVTSAENLQKVIPSSEK